MPSPMTRMIHSSKFLGLPWAVVLATLASTSPVKQLICNTNQHVVTHAEERALKYDTVAGLRQSQVLQSDSDLTAHADANNA